jgi:hypothetical protein
MPRLLHLGVPSVTTAEKNVIVFQWLSEVSSIPLGSTILKKPAATRAFSFRHALGGLT